MHQHHVSKAKGNLAKSRHYHFIGCHGLWRTNFYTFNFRSSTHL